MYKYGTTLILTEKLFSENSHCLKNIVENALGKIFLPHYHVNIPYSWVGEWVTVKGRRISAHRFNKLRDFWNNFLHLKLILYFSIFWRWPLLTTFCCQRLPEKLASLLYESFLRTFRWGKAYFLKSWKSLKKCPVWSTSEFSGV